MDKKGRILLFTGDGKGKTTAALGMAMRASGHGLKGLVLQFVKADESTGEIEACRHLPGITIEQAGLGFVPARTDPGFLQHVEAARAGLARAEAALTSGDFDMVLLDEICTAVAKGLLDEDRVLEALGKAAPHICIVLTGRGATEGMVTIADTVTEMHLVKHGLAQGIVAQQGVEY